MLLTVAFAAAASMALVSVASSAAVDSGQRTFVILISSKVTSPASWSVSIRDVNHRAPNTGSVLPFERRENAARQVTLLPASFSGCGW